MLSLVTPLGGAQVSGGLMLLGICVPGITIDPSGSTTVPLGKLLAESILVPAGNLMPGGITTSDATLTPVGIFDPAGI